MLHVYFIKDYKEYKKGDQANIGRQEASVLHFNGMIEMYTEHIERIGNEPDRPEPEKPKRKSINKETAVSRRAEKREKAVNG
ncbi:hypothetical protein LCGC14_2954290 [marine sediment metagenome]|uniref:Uncharacterized protein n=1 Tax=marine sediment metagenome TaxID=412755 RepID=A0A0F8XE08_9ZZZZ